MAVQKACKACKSTVEGSKCAKCGSTEIAENSKGRVVILNVEKSEVSKSLGIKEKGSYALRLG